MKIGLVLAGGGCKGAYQIGVWKALKELGLDKYIQGVSGTSIGALNAILFAQGDCDLAENVWMNITREKVLPIDNVDLFTRGVKLFLGNRNINFIKKYVPKLLEQGNVSRQGLVDIMDEYLDFDKIFSSGKTIYATCTEIPEVKVKYFRLNEYDVETAKKILFASSAIPPVFGCEEIGRMKYVDGGLVDNVPIQPLYVEGFDMIFVVQLDRDLAIDMSKFPKAKIIKIAPSSDQGGIFSGVLDFSNESIVKRIKVGYEDTMDLIAPIFEVQKYKLKRMPREFINTIIGNLKEKILNLRKASSKNN